MLTCTRTTHVVLDESRTLRFNANVEPPTLDWTKCIDVASALIIHNMMDGLLKFDFSKPQIGVLPGLAESWSSPDGRVWTFRLKKNIMWSDNVLLTPQHVLDGFERLLNPKTAAPYAYTLYDVKNAKAFNVGTLKDFSKVGVRILGQDLIVELEHPKSYFPMMMTHTSTYPVRKDLINKYGERWTDPEHIAVLGPFKLKTWEHDNSILLERNRTYYGTKPKLENILFYLINDSATAINLFDVGKLDGLYRLQSRDVLTLKKKKEYKHGGLLNILYYGFNVKVVPTNNLKVRRAIAMSINKKQITDMLANGDIPMTSWLPPGMPGYEPEVGLKFDPVQAKALLDEAGYKDRTQFPKLYLSFNTNEDHQRVAENIQSQLKENLNIEVELKNEEWKTYLSGLKHNATPLFRMGWQGDFPDPDNFLTSLLSYSENNMMGWVNVEFDRLIESAAVERDPQSRLELYRKAQKILTEQDVALIPLYSQSGQYLVSERVKNFPINAIENLRFDQVELTK